MYPIEITLSDPMPNVRCLACGKEYQYDSFMSGWGCLILKDERIIPPTIWGAWCDETCFTRWYATPESIHIFDKQEVSNA